MRIEESEHMMDSRRIDPGLYIAAHKHSSRHRAEIEASERCGCFFCFRSFASVEIKTWIDANQTALCPRCGVDSVIGSASQHRIDDVFLRGMHAHFFSSGKR
jgi:hypothetical protein